MSIYIIGLYLLNKLIDVKCWKRPLALNDRSYYCLKNVQVRKKKYHTIQSIIYRHSLIHIYRHKLLGKPKSSSRDLNKVSRHRKPQRKIPYHSSKYSSNTYNPFQAPCQIMDTEVRKLDIISLLYKIFIV